MLCPMKMSNSENIFKGRLSMGGCQCEEDKCQWWKICSGKVFDEINSNLIDIETELEKIKKLLDKS